MEAVIIMLVSTLKSIALFLCSPCMMSALSPVGKRTEQSSLPWLVSTPISEGQAAAHGWGQLLVPLAARERSRGTRSLRARLFSTSPADNGSRVSTGRRGREAGKRQG